MTTPVEPAPRRLRSEIVDFSRVRQRGGPAGRTALARRIFALWQPIFSHLDGKDFTFHLHKHVEDETPASIRGIFGVDETGRDRALMIVRVHEHEIAGRTWARLTVNAGFEPSLVQSHFGQGFLATEAWRYRARHPLRPFFIVDCAVSAASYCAYEKTYCGFAPTRLRAIPDAWWPLAEVGAEALDCARLEGKRREVRRATSIVRDPSPRRPSSERSRAGARFFEEITGGDPTAAVLVMAPLGFAKYGHTSLRWGWLRARRALGLDGRASQ